MIYYFCSSYSTFLGDSSERNLIVSQAACNRINEIVNVLSKNNKITIVNISITKAVENFEESIQELRDDCKVYFPPIKCGGLQNVQMILSAIKFVKKNLHAGDIIMFYNAHYLMLPIIYSFAYRKSVKIVYQIEELYSTCDYYRSMKKTLLQVSERSMSKVCNAYVAVSESLGNIYLKKKPGIISYGYIDATINYSYVEEKDSESFNIVYAGRLDIDGGIDVLLDLIPHINRECKLIITGMGPLVEKVLKYHNNNPKVKMDYYGFVSDAELDVILREADVCLSMLRTDKEFSQKSFPSKVIKYLSYGSLVISSNVPALNELKEVCSNLLIYGNEEELKEMIEKAYIISRKMNKAEQKEKFDKFYDMKRRELVQFFNGASEW